MDNLKVCSDKWAVKISKNYCTNTNNFTLWFFLHRNLNLLYMANLLRLRMNSLSGDNENHK